MVITDTSFLVALANSREKHHKECVEVAAMITERPLLPVTVLPEVAYLLDKQLGHATMQLFLRNILQPGWQIECPNQSDFVRSLELLKIYSDNRLDFVDATLIALAERFNIRTVLTLDRRHFQAIRPRHCPAFDLLP